MAKKPKSKKSNAPKAEPGRPSQYRPEYAAQLIEYFGEPPYKEDADGKIKPTDFKSLAGFAVRIGVHRDTLHEWSKVHADFSDAYARAKDFQENFLVVNGNRGLINSNFGIFTAQNVLGWRSKKEVEHTEKPYESLTDDELQTQTDALLKRLGK